MNRPYDEPAFPCSHETGEGVRWYSGMTLRDYFAGKAMAALINGRLVQKTGVVGVNNFEHGIAKEAYQCADAMLVERSKP